MIPDMKQNKHKFCSHLCDLAVGVGGGGLGAQPLTPTRYHLQDEAKAKAEGLLEGNLFRKRHEGGVTWKMGNILAWAHGRLWRLRLQASFLRLSAMSSFPWSCSGP